MFCGIEINPVNTTFGRQRGSNIKMNIKITLEDNG
jgi:hypothetical protein